MNKPQFLAELNQYLTFFTPDERTAVMASFTQKFDEAGEAGEAALMVELGTPMRVAIDLKRRQESGDNFDDLFGTTGEAPEYNVETETPETLFDEADTAAVTGADVASETPPEENAVPADTAEETAAVEAEETGEIAESKQDDSGAATAAVAEKPAKRKKSVGGIIGATILSIVVIAVFLCVAAVGALGLTAAGYFIMAGFTSLRTLTDALFLFAGGLVLGGVGLLAVWFAIWAAISIVRKLFSVPEAAEISVKPAGKIDGERDTK